MLPAESENVSPQSIDLPTFVFTDIEGSTRKWETFPHAMRAALERHDALLHESIARNGGHVFKTVGDAFCAVFSDTASAVAAVLEAQEALARQIWDEVGPLRIRVGIHTGPVQERGSDYFGATVNRVARIQDIGHGGQTLLSEAAAVPIQDALPAGAWLKDLGSHRLKDLGQPEHVFQLCHPDLPDDFPPLRSLQAFANNLPVQMSSFIGRGQEMRDLANLMDRHRLVTLLGPGGTGKTRLSLQVAAERLEEYGGGVWFADLAPITDGVLVPKTLTDALGVREEAGRSLTESLIDYLRPKTALLILDNCEHLIGACATLAQSLLQTCPSVRMLATSREALSIPGERAWRVPALSLPDPQDLSTDEKNLGAVLLEYDAVRLFVDRARSARESFVLRRENARAVSEICLRLDGIPLALELAAARARVLSVEQIQARLDDRFKLLTGGSRTALPRQQTLRALIDWSYDLLNAEEKTLLGRLSVFAGGWDFEALEAVCLGDGIDGADALDLLTSLLDKSLAILEEESGTIRYRMLETVRQYALERLQESGTEAQIRTRHRDCYLALAEEAEPHLRGSDQSRWLSRLEMEHDNLRAALSLCATEAEPKGGETWLRLCVSLRWFWDRRGHYSEGRRWLGRALDRTAGAPPSLMRVRVLHAAGVLARNQGDYAEARTLYRASLEGARLQEDRLSIAHALNGLGNIATEQGDYGAAQALYGENLALSRQIGDRRGIAVALNNLGNVAYNQGDYAASQTLHEESLDLFRQIGDQSGVAAALSNLGLVLNEQDEYERARALFEESLDLKRQIGDQRGIAVALGNLGLVAMEQGDSRASQALYGKSLELHRQTGDRRGIAIALCGLANLADVRRDYAAARTLREESLSLSRQIGHRDGIADSLEGLATVALEEGDAARSGRIWGASALLREQIGNPLPPRKRARQKSQWDQARASIGTEAFAAAFAAGRTLTLEQAVKEALRES